MVKGASAAAPKAAPARSRADSVTLMQQLRGVFAACDENRDGLLSKDELTNALLALCIKPTLSTVQKYHFGSPTGVVDAATFISVTMSRMHEFESNSSSILQLFQEFDPGHSGLVPSRVLRHLLSEVQADTALSAREVDDLLHLTGVASLDGSYKGFGVSINYVDFVHTLALR